MQDTITDKAHSKDSLTDTANSQHDTLINRVADDMSGKQNKQNPEPQTADKATGLGWSEKYMGGSEKAEQAFIKQAMSDINQVQQTNKDKAHAPDYKRAFHANIRAGVDDAIFRVSPNLPPEFQVGFFQPGKEYHASIRFSNASGVDQPDTAKDLRGFAMRVDAGGDEKHDYLATNGIVNHARDAKQFIDFAKASAGSRLMMIPRLLHSEGLFETIRMLKTVESQTSHPVQSLATETYWSRAPYEFGPRALKFQITPEKSSEANVAKGPNYLREDLEDRLKKGPVVFDFQVQLYKDEKSTPIEDGSVQWKTPLTTIAQIVIPQQDLNSPQAQKDQSKVENMEFNPWNTTAEFRPLGGLNRARRDVYKSSVDQRKDKK